MSKICTVLLTDKAYFNKAIYTLQGILSNKHEGDICLVIGDDLKDTKVLNHPILENVIIKHFPDIQFSKEFDHKFDSINRRGLPFKQKKFQYHKFHMFNEYFKQWDYIFYIDSGITIFNSIIPILKEAKPNTFFAHSDSYPTYEWKLSFQFDSTDKSFKELNEKYNLDINYPQTTIMLYDTNIIESNTFDEIKQLAEDVKISVTNDQGILALYFTNIRPLWEQIPLGNESTWFYDYLWRQFKSNKPYIMRKR